MEFPFKGWDMGFNIMVQRMAELVAPGFTVGPDAPETLEALTAYVEKHKAIRVSDENSGDTIYGYADVNYAARAWHDWTHWKHQIPFTPEGEKLTYERQLVDMMAVYGVDANSLRWAQMLYADIVGQTEYFERWGVYATQQRAFNLAYLASPRDAIESGAFHALDLTGVTPERAAVIRHGIG